MTKLLLSACRCATAAAVVVHRLVFLRQRLCYFHRFPGITLLCQRLCCCFQPIGSVVELLPPPLPSPIPLTRHISSADASVVVKVQGVIFFSRRHHRCHRSLGPIFEPPPLLPSSPIPRTCHLSTVLCRRLCCCRWFLRPVLLHKRRCCHRKSPGPAVTPPPPPPLETFPQACCHFLSLHWRLYCHLWIPWTHIPPQRICCRRQVLRLVINTPQPFLLSLNHRARCHFYFHWWRLCCWFLGITILRRCINCCSQSLRTVIVTPPTQS